MSDWTTLRSSRRRRNGLRQDGRRRAGRRVLAGGHARRGPGPLRPALRRPRHRGRPHRGAARHRRGRRRPHAVRACAASASSLDEAHVVGDLDGLGSRLDKLTAVAEEKAGEARAARDAARVEALARKTALVEEAEKIAAESTQWKSAGDRLREILDEWKTIKGIDKKTDGELWKRYSAARDGFTRRRGTHFASLDAQRKQATGRKEELVAEAETLADSTDWTATANRLKELMAEWKAAPRAAKDVEQKLWERFRAAQDAFFARRSEVFSARDAEQKVSLDASARRCWPRPRRSTSTPTRRPPRPGCARSRRQWHDAGRVAARGRRRARPPAAGRRRQGPRRRWTPPGAAPRRTPTRCSTRCASRSPRPRTGWPGPRPPATPSASGGPGRAGLQAALPRARRAGR